MLVDRLREFLNSEEGKKSIEEWNDRLVQEEEHQNRWIEKFKSRFENNLDTILERLINKYYSSDYVKREYKMGFMPREPLMFLVYEYAKKYCEPCEDQKYFNMFTDEAYYIGSYVIQLMIGQGSSIRIDKIN